MKKHNVMIGFTEVAGYCSNLKKGFEQNGINCKFISFSDHRFEYENDDETNLNVRLIKYAYKKTFSGPKTNALWMGIYILLRIPLFIWSLIKFDTFIFIYSSSFFKTYDLPILKLFKKKIIYIYAGSDSRPPYINGGFIIGDTAITIKECIKLSKRMKNEILKVEKYADYIIDHPASGHFHEKPFVQGLTIGIPFNNNLDIKNVEGTKTGVVRILHAPSNPLLKGSDKIREAIEHLRQKKYEIDYVEIKGVPHDKVLEEISKCDFIVDQIYSDTPMATFTTEAAWYGKPAVVGSYYADDIHKDVPEEFIPPSMFCHPDRLACAIEKLICDVEYRNYLGNSAREYVKKNRNAKVVAQNYIRLIEGNVPENWMFDPIKIKYILGFGLSEKKIKEIITDIIENYGKDSLQLSDKPDLEKRFTDFQS